MSNDLLKYAFVAGELSPSLLGRTDLTKYDLAMAEAYNLFVDYRGGLSSRAGTEFVDYIPDYVEGLRTLEVTEPPLLFTFELSPDYADNFLGIICPVNAPDTTTFDHSIIRFVQNGRYVTEPGKTITGVTLANPGVVTTSPAHGFTSGDWVKFQNQRGMVSGLRNRTVEVDVLTSTTFRMKSLTDGALINTTGFDAYTGSFTVGRLLTLQCSYEPSQYATMCIKQYHDLVRITHPAHPIRNLIRTDDPMAGVMDENANTWYIENEVIGSDAVGPAITSFSFTSGDSHALNQAEVLFAITAVYEGDDETARGPLYHITNIVNYAATQGSVSINWAADPAALYYKVYRSIISYGEVLTSGSELGFVGQTRGTRFTDPNIIPDFSRTPPRKANPFAPKPIASVRLTAGGTGYVDFQTPVTAGGTGTGFAADAVVNAAGEVVNVAITHPGHGYAVGDLQAGIAAFGGAGTGAAAEVTVNPTYGTYPGVSCVYQQRQIYAASYDRPTTLWGSTITLFSNFDNTSNLTDSESFQYTLDVPTTTAIRHLIPTQGGLLVTTQDSIWVVNDGQSGAPITPTNIVAVPQTYNGCAQVTPIKIGSDLLYAEGKGNAVRMLAYNEISRVYSGDDRSILSSHLFGLNKQISSWAYQEAPFKVVWSARSDGAMLAFTVVKSEEIYAWTQCGTRGQFLTVGGIREDNSSTDDVIIVNDRIYLVVQRFLQGRWRRMIERIGLRNFVNLEDAYCVDSGVSLLANTISGNLNLWEESGVWYAQTDTGDLTGLGDLITEYAEVRVVYD